MTLTNIYPIENLDTLKCNYRSYEVKGIPTEINDYYAVTQALSRKLSEITHSPCILQTRKGKIIISQPEGHEPLPNEFPVVGASAVIEPIEGTSELKFGSLSPDEVELALRFLQFSAVGLLKKHPNFWIPKSGPTIFNKTPDPAFAVRNTTINMYRGFRFRFVRLPNHGIGLCVDVGRKYVDSRPLPAIITKDDFRRFKGRNCVYEYGDTWYQVKIEGLLDDLDVSKVKLADGVSLFDHIKNLPRRQQSPLIDSLPKDCSVLTYHTSKGEVRRMPSALCRLAYRTQSPKVSQYHSYSIMDPERRKKEIDYVVDNHLRGLFFEGRPIALANTPISFETKPFALPGLLFGNRRILSSFDRKDADVVSLMDWGFSKRKLLLSPDAGFWSKGPLHQQYLVLPKSFHHAVGDSFLKKLKEQFKAIYSPTGEFEYNPSIILYDSSVGRSVPVLGREILRAVTNGVFYSGFGLVVIPKLPQTRENDEDELANLLMRELRNRDVHVSIMHEDHALEFYTCASSSDGTRKWELTKDGRQLSRYRSYLQNIVINKILLLNSRWPFVLADSLHADLTIGIDVKNNTAGFTFIMKDGRTIWSTCSDSAYSERLSNIQCSAVIFKQLENRLSAQSPLKHIVVHRDGRSYPSEEEGLRDGFRRLAAKGLVLPEFDLNLIEVQKTTSTPVRFFEPVSILGSQTVAISNPQVGAYLTLFDNAYLATTGLPYNFPGTSKPIHVSKVSGNMPFEFVLEDLFCLSSLTWTRIEDCSRVPLSIKITDIRLREVAGDYNRDYLHFDAQEEEI